MFRLQSLFFILFFAYKANFCNAVSIFDVHMEQLFDKKIGFYAGSFDPFHKGHEKVVSESRYIAKCDYVLICVSGPADSYKPDRSPAFPRRKMVEELFQNDPHVLTSLRTARELQEYLNPHMNRLNFIGIIGSDTLLNIVMHEAKGKKFMKGLPIAEDQADHGEASCQVVKVSEFIVSLRVGDSLSVRDGEYVHKRKINILPDPYQENSLSSTQIKKYIKEESGLLNLERYLDVNIINFIQKNNFYS